MSENENNKFETWGILELFGHLRLAGKISEQTIGGATMIRIDVPAVNDAPEYTRLFGSAAIYGITPTSEDIARAFCRNHRPEPISPYELNYERKLASPADDIDDDDDLGIY